MKFRVSSSVLLKSLNSLAGVVASNPVVPILENFLFDIQNGKLRVTASDLQNTMIVELEVEAEENARMAVPAKMLLDTLKNLPDQGLVFTLDSVSYTIEISANNNSRYKLAGENPEDFPRIPELGQANGVDMTSEVMASAIATTLFAVGTDDIKPQMMGLNVQFNSGSIVFAATDGHRLVRYSRFDAKSPFETSLLVPRKALALLKNVLPSANTNLNVQFNRNNIFFSFGSCRVICRLLDEVFPEYQNVIPLNNNNCVDVNREDFISCLKRMMIYANKTTNQVKLRISGSQLLVSAEDIDFSNEASEILACEHDGADIEIGFSARFLLEVLSNLHSESITLKLNTPEAAALVVPKVQNSEEDILMLLMPVKLYHYA